MKVLSLFDGMSCAMLALLEQGIEVDKYVAYEIDKYAIQTASHNFPMIEQRGDVFEADFTEFKGFDFVMGGSPCTYWSIAQKNNRETEASGMGWELFSQYVRAIKEAEPKYFIYENNKSMSNAIRESITDTFGFEPICINSSLVSAQNRQRLYWVGKRNADGTYSKVEVEQPEDRGILLKDIIEDGVVDKDKAYCLKHQAGNARDYFKKHHTQIKFEPVAINTTDGGEKAKTVMAGYYKYGTATLITNKGFKGGTTAVAEPVNITDEGKSQTIKDQYYKNSVANMCCYTSTYGASGVAEPVCVAQRGRYTDSGNRSVKGNGPIEQYYEAREDGKSNVLTTVQKDNYIAEPVGGVGIWQYPRGYNKGGVKYGKSPTLTANASWQHNNLLIQPVNTEAEITAKAPTQTTQSGSKTNSSTELIASSICYAESCEWDESGKPLKAISYADGKTYQVYEVKDGLITIKGKQYPIKLADGYYIIRKLTVRECMRLQTVPEWYEFPVSDTQAYKMLGNGWTIAVIAHLIQSITNEKETKRDLFGTQMTVLDFLNEKE